MFYQPQQLKTMFDKVKSRARKTDGMVMMLCSYEIDSLASVKLLSVF
jgi:hypothetical protein